MSDDASLFETLESDLATVELQAHLMELITSSVHKLTALGNILGWWKTKMREVGYTDETIEKLSPMIIERIWPTEGADGFHEEEGES